MFAISTIRVSYKRYSCVGTTTCYYETEKNSNIFASDSMKYTCQLRYMHFVFAEVVLSIKLSHFTLIKCVKETP